MIKQDLTQSHRFVDETGAYTNMLVDVLQAIVERSESAGDDGLTLIDAKLDLSTGVPFAQDDVLRGPAMVYPWIQGRGLEAFAGHAMWLAGDTRHASLRERILVLLPALIESLETLRQRGGGTWWFMMRRDGQAMRIGDDGAPVAYTMPSDPPANFSMLFYCKGLAAAAAAVGDAKRVETAEALYQRVHDDLMSGRFASDQQSLDPKNVAAKPVAGRHSQGPMMIAIGAATRFYQVTGKRMYAQWGCDYIQRICEKHVQTGENGPFQRGDMWEFIDNAGEPYRDEQGRVLSDPGHCTEFVGLAMKHLQACGADVLGDRAARDALAHTLCAVLTRGFANGFSQKGFGICKAYDLVARRVINSDMPWWSLPETIRAAVACDVWQKGVGQSNDDTCMQIADRCSNAFWTHYVRPQIHHMAVQTLNDQGQPVQAIPATPDADPGYHTGLSLIDAMEAEGTKGRRD